MADEHKHHWVWDTFEIHTNEGEVTDGIEGMRCACGERMNVDQVQNIVNKTDEAPILRAQIDAFWNALSSSWDIEPREYFEAEIAKGIGFDDSPLAMAVHYMWKREAKR